MSTNDLFNDKAFNEMFNEAQTSNREITKSDITQVTTNSIDDIPSKVVANGSKLIFDILSDYIVQGYRIEVRGFGSFSVRYRPPRNAHNPRNGEKVITLGKFIPHFKAGIALKERINKLINKGNSVLNEIEQEQEETV